VNTDFELTGEINNLDISALEFEPYFKTSSSKLGLNTKLMFGKNIIESYANKFLDTGYKLPLPQNITRFIKNQKVSPKEGYLLIEGDAEFSNKPGIKILTTRRMLQGTARRPDHIQNAQGQEVSETVRESRERFYSLVQDTYLLKLSNGEFNRSNYNNIEMIVDDLMRPVTENLTAEALAEIQLNWTDAMKVTHSQVVSDFK
jgi:hypothetical protein